MRTGIFAVGAVILVLGLIPVLIFGSFTGSAESMFGGWAMLSEDYQKWRIYVSIGQIMTVIGIIIMIPGIVLKKKENDESTFKYKDEEIQPETHSEKVIPKKPKRDLRKSPTLKGIIIGIITVSIIWVATLGLSYQTFTMTNDAMAPTINKGDLVRYDNTPFHEIQVDDIIFYDDNDKVWIHKVISVISSKGITTLKVMSEENAASRHVVTEEQYIGKLDSVIGGGVGYISIIFDPIVFFIVLIAAFAIPITVMKIRG